MNKLTFRNSIGPSDAAALFHIHESCRDADGLIPGLNFEEEPSQLDIEAALGDSDPLDWTIVEDMGDVVAYGHALHSWLEEDGRKCYLHLGWVNPQYRGRGIGTGLLSALEKRCTDKARQEGYLGNADLGANASGSELAAQELLKNSGYGVLYTMLEMELPMEREVVPGPLPAGYELRPVLADHRYAVWQAIGDAYYDHTATEQGVQTATENDFSRYFESRSADPMLWFVAWSHTRIAAVVLCKMEGGIAEVYEVSVGHSHRRKGLGLHS